MMRIHFASMEQETKRHLMHVLQPANLDIPHIQEYAEEVGRNHKIYQRPETDLNLLMRQIGGSVDLTGGKVGLIIRGSNNFTVHLLESTSRIQDRYFVAQQIGHYLLHYRLPGFAGTKHRPYKMLREETNRQLVEETSTFARALLLPSIEFRKSYQELRGDVQLMEVLHKVPMFLLRERATELGL